MASRARSCRPPQRLPGGKDWIESPAGIKLFRDFGTSVHTLPGAIRLSLADLQVLPKTDRGRPASLVGMPTQGELFEGTGPRTQTPHGDSGTGAGAGYVDSPARESLHDPLRVPDPEGAPAPVWLQRMSLIILVLFCFYIGALLTVLPWSPRFWDGNGWLRAHPGLHDVLMQGWARGILSGFGLLDIWIGISEMLHYRDFRKTDRAE